MKKSKEDENLNKIVEKILKLSPECREGKGSSVVLAIKVYQEVAREHKAGIFIPYTLIPFLPSPESILRCRREIINHKGEFMDDYGMEGITFEPRNKLLEREQ